MFLNFKISHAQEILEILEKSYLRQVLKSVRQSQNISLSLFSIFDSFQVKVRALFIVSVSTQYFYLFAVMEISNLALCFKMLRYSIKKF